MQGAPQIRPLEFEAGSPVTLPADTNIDVKTCNSEEVHLENTSPYFFLGKNCTGADAKGAGHPTTPENGLSSWSSQATDCSHLFHSI